MPSISRREFLESASIFAAIGMVAPRAHSSSCTPGADVFFFDERFVQARQLAQRLAWSELTPVRSDVTPIRDVTLNRITQSPAAMLRGITTESFHFCLATMLKEHARIETGIERVDRDLYAWSLRATRSNTTALRLKRG